ncbi:hypothetical protein FKM82_005790 [Ascaphus truei]
MTWSNSQGDYPFILTGCSLRRTASHSFSHITGDPWSILRSILLARSYRYMITIALAIPNSLPLLRTILQSGYHYLISPTYNS